MQPHTLTNSYTKEQLHEAFSVEHRARVQLNKQLLEETKLTAQTRYERDKYMEDWLRLHIEKYVECDHMEESLDAYFNDPTRRVFFTPSHGYICVIEREDCLFIAFAYANTKKAKDEYRDFPILLERVRTYSQRPLRWHGKINVLKNHSIEVVPGLYELDLH